ncbi:MAG: DNA mismatch repair endonuclease MutH [Candidatus Dasytiphilus stammeri]
MLMKSVQDYFLYEIIDNEKTLLALSQSLAGYNLGDLAAHVGLKIPIDLKSNKGWIGNLIEKCLGVNAKSKPQPDFSNLGIELKTIPINSYGCPLQSTFICSVSLSMNKNIGITWKISNVRHKISRILWVPIEGEKKVPLPLRRVGTPFLWSPNSYEEDIIRCDWEELITLIICGEIENVSTRNGEVLQIRHKAIINNKYPKIIGKDGHSIIIRPLSFYLRKNFTAIILARQFLL